LETERQRQSREDADVVGEIGMLLARAELLRIAVRLPLTIARAAVEAWNRVDEAELDPELFEQRLVRRGAAALPLIGLSIEKRGRTVGDEVVVELSPSLVGSAVDAADDLPS
jgi:hypothetical protein